MICNRRLSSPSTSPSPSLSPAAPESTPGARMENGAYRIVLSLGSNIGDSPSQLATVKDRAAQVSRVRSFSALFSTAPWGGVDQDDFINAVVVVESPRSPQWWLKWAQQCEESAERKRSVRWGPRTLDVDIVSVRQHDYQSGLSLEVSSDDPDLILPHPRAHERAFVIVPWLDADPYATLRGRPLAKYLAQLPKDEVSGIKVSDRQWPVWDDSFLRPQES